MRQNNLIGSGLRPLSAFVAKKVPVVALFLVSKSSQAFLKISFVIMFSQ